jgi:Zn-dependent metalloprotease
LVALSTSQVSALESGGRGTGFLLRDDQRGGGSVHDVGGSAINYTDNGAGGYNMAFANVDDFNNAPIMFDADNVWGSVNAAQTDPQRMGAEAHYGVSKTWDYYVARYGRQGMLGNGAGVKSFINIGTTYNGIADARFATNAFYTQESMFYYKGQPGVSKPVVALDVAAHEMSHGVTAATNRLIYDRDSGGLNEANSDIHGALTEYFDNSAVDPADYMVGEGVNEDGHPLRYMFKPSLDNQSFNCYPVGGFVSKAVRPAHDPHYSSGVGNHFFYLLAEGQVVPPAQARFNKAVTASSLDCRNRTGLVKAGIGREAAGRIWYRANTVHFVDQTTYPQARAWTQQAARELVALGQVNANTVNAVACAWEAVSVALPADSAEARCVR